MTILLIIMQPFWLWMGWRLAQGKSPIPSIPRPVRVVGGDEERGPMPVKHRL